MIFHRRHVHAPQPAEVQYQLLSLLSGEAPWTVVLCRCACGELSTRTLKGRWTLAQVTGIVEAEIVCGHLEYPYADGHHILLGPECFTEATEHVISYKGSNYYLPESLPGTGTSDG